jgi:hypothetical protein
MSKRKGKNDKGLIVDSSATLLNWKVPTKTKEENKIRKTKRDNFQ